MLVALGENSIKTVEDLADCATDDLAGWSERKDKETVRHDGILDGFGLSRERVEELILARASRPAGSRTLRSSPPRDLAMRPSEGADAADSRLTALARHETRGRHRLAARGGGTRAG